MAIVRWTVSELSFGSNESMVFCSRVQCSSLVVAAATGAQASDKMTSGASIRAERGMACLYPGTAAPFFAAQDDTSPMAPFAGKLLFSTDGVR